VISIYKVNHNFIFLKKKRGGRAHTNPVAQLQGVDLAILKRTNNPLINPGQSLTFSTRQQQKTKGCGTQTMMPNEALAMHLKMKSNFLHHPQLV